MWIKICGNTNLEDARLAVESGADALGFVFAPSPRQVTSAQVQRISGELSPQLEKYGVFVDAPFAEIVATVEACGLTGVQLHHSRNRELLNPESLERDMPLRLREHFAEAGRKLRVVRVLNLAAQGDRDPGGVRGDSTDRNQDRILDRALAEASREPAVEAVLVDSYTAAAVGGTGVSFDWAAAQASFLRAAGKVRIILAGGLRPENVKQAISTLRPWGVDVVSGVEAFPGKKDSARLLAFIQAAREADAGLAGAE